MDYEEEQQHTVPVIEEELVAGTRAVVRGSVRIRKEVERTEESIDIATMRDAISVTRVPINREVAEIPAIREEGTTMIIPVVEEELVVHKRLVLKEEIHIHRERIQEQTTQSVTVGRERAVVERLDSAGNVVATSEPTAELPIRPNSPPRRLLRNRRESK